MTAESKSTTSSRTKRLLRAVPPLLLLLGAVHVPLVLGKALLMDDWAWLWIRELEGQGSLFDLLRQCAHPGFWPTLALSFEFGGWSGSVGRAIPVLFQGVNAVLLYRILRHHPATRTLSVIAAAVFVLSPLYFSRPLISINVYDPALCLYLSSILLTATRYQPLAYVLLILSFAYEPLIFLEPLRLFHLWARRDDRKELLRAYAPFLLLCAALLAGKLVFLQPFDHYAGYNQMKLSPRSVIPATLRHLRYVALAMGFDGWVASRGNLFTLMFFFGAIFLILRRMTHMTASLGGDLPRSKRWTGLWLGLVLAVAGALPFALIRRWPQVDGKFNRFAYVSMIGVSVVVAWMLMSLPHRTLRTVACAAVLSIFAQSSLELGKWWMYDNLVQRDMILQLHCAFPDKNPGPMIVVSTAPESQHAKYLRRFDAMSDLTVPLNILRDSVDRPIFVYDARYVPFLPPGTCSVSTFDRYPRPDAEIHCDYRLKPEYGSYREMSIAKLLKYTYGTTAPQLGELSVSGVPPKELGRSLGELNWDVPRVRRLAAMLGITRDFRWENP